MPTAKQQYADHLLGGKLAEFVAERRAAGAGWRRIATDLRETTGISASHETVRSWFPEDPAPKCACGHHTTTPEARPA
jgi:hypothetical protein